MSFRINTNIAAANALRNVSGTSDAFQASIGRLSTGLRINSAADDPAGLIISEKYKAQLSGLDQATKNSQDGINFAKTAEGALNEVNGLLRDARSLAVASANTGTLSASALQANQAQINSIVTSINRIASTTQFGSKKLLDGSAGTSATVTDATKVSTVSIGGTFGGQSLSANGGVTITVSTAATQATLSSKGFAFATTTAGSNSSFTLNGVTFSVASSDTAQNIIDKVNQAQNQTGVAAVYNSTTNKIQFNTTKYGSAQSINLTDASGVVASAAGFSTASGTDAVATVTVGSTSVLFTGGKSGKDGLTLTDADGNTVALTTAGNSTSTTNASVGQVVVGSAQFQIGAFSGQNTSLSLSNFAASNLGTGVASGVNLSTIDLTTQSGANQAIQVIDSAIDQISTARGNIGNFQRNVLESNIRSLGVASENLSAANSTITDTDVASETTNYTKLQILQQAGISVLAQANQAPQQVLRLLQ